MTISKFEDARATTVEIAGDMAWGQIKDWHAARDSRPTMSADACRDLAGEIAREWIGRSFDDDCVAIGVETLRRMGFEMASGDLNGGTIRAAKR